jgi:tetratricopeptide (TPR) repeat protein
MSLLACCVFVGACRGGKGGNAAGVDRYNRGVALLEQGDYKGAIIEFEAALRADPNSFEATKNLAGAFILEQNWEEARRYLGRAMEMRPDDPSIYANLACVYKELGEPELAWDMVRTSLEKDPAYPLAHYRAGELFLAQGDPEDAMKAFGDCMRLEPGSRLAYDAEDIINALMRGEQPGAAEETQAVDEGTEEEEAPVEAEEEAPQEETLVEEQPEEVAEAPEEELPDERIEETPAEEETPEQPEEPVEVTEQEEQAEGAAAETEEAGETGEGAVEEPEETEERPLTIEDLDLPELSGDELYQDRLSRGRQMRARGLTSLAIDLLKIAYDVHPDYAQVNYELGLAYLADGQTEPARTHLERYLTLETDPARRAEVEARLAELEQEDSGGEEEEGESENGEEEEEFRFF